MIWANPVKQAEAIEQHWDEHLSKLPICSRCGKHIESPQLVYIPTHNEYYCLDCIEAMTEFNEEAEVE